MTWTVVLPVKQVSRAKTRLTLPARERSALVLAFAADTVRAALSTEGVATVLVVSPDPVLQALARSLGAAVKDDARPLNAALAAAVDGNGAVACLTADLPALRPEELGDALVRAAGLPRSFVADTQGSGTTMLARTSGALQPTFGPLSAERHRRGGAVELLGPWPGLRRDVDTLDDLAVAAGLGVGATTASLLTDLALLQT